MITGVEYHPTDIIASDAPRRHIDNRREAGVESINGPNNTCYIRD